MNTGIYEQRATQFETFKKAVKARMLSKVKIHQNINKNKVYKTNKIVCSKLQ